MQKPIRHMITMALLLEILLMLTTPTLKVAAQTYYVGVETNDYFTYGKFNIWIDPSNAPLLPNQEKFQNMTSINFTITTSPQPKAWEVYFNQQVAFQNSTIRSFAGGVNLQTGLGQGYLFFIPAGLAAGDMIYPLGTGQNFTWTLNETRNDPRWGRDICFYNSTSLDLKGEILFYRSIVIKWDKPTGVLLSLREVNAGYGGQGTPTIEAGLYYQLVATNRFVVPESGPSEMTTLIIVVGAVLATALVVAVVKVSISSPKKKWKRLK